MICRYLLLDKRPIVSYHNRYEKHKDKQGPMALVGQMKQPNLKALRTKHGLSIKQASRLCKVSTATWWLTESGQNVLRPETIEKITSALKAYKQG